MPTPPGDNAPRLCFRGPERETPNAGPGPREAPASEMGNQRLAVVTWLWRSRHTRTRYTAEHVNIWARMVRRNLSIPARIVCITDDGDGISEADTLPIPDASLEDVANRAFPERAGNPHCYRRLALWRRDVADWLGAERILCMDLDGVICGSLDPIVLRSEPVIIFRGTSRTRPYNGSMLMLDAGARPEVYEDFTPAEAERASRRFVGSDQAWMMHKLGPNCAVFDERDGAYHCDRSMHFKLRRGHDLPEDMRVLWFTGRAKPWQWTGHPQIARHYQ